ncbi:MAG: GNAT family N-acetyltransferase [Solirubrobacteraceae bacterium]
MARLEPPVEDDVLRALEQFDCVVRYTNGQPDAGELMVRDFLANGAVPGAELGTSTTYLALDPQLASGAILGYITLTLSHVRLTTGEKRAGAVRDAWGADFGALRIAMIGTDHRFAGRGFGHALLRTAIRRAVLMSEQATVRFIVADAVDTQRAWYERQGFVENRSLAERERLARARQRTGVAATSMRLDLGADPRLLAR